MSFSFLLPSTLESTSLLVQFSHTVMSDSSWPCWLQQARPPCASPTPGAYSNSFPLSRWCRPTISSSVVPFSSCLQSFSASGSFPTSQLFASGGQSTGVSASASVLPMNIQDWFPLGLTGWISLQATLCHKSKCKKYTLHLMDNRVEAWTAKGSEAKPSKTGWKAAALPNTRYWTRTLQLPANECCGRSHKELPHGWRMGD